MGKSGNLKYALEEHLGMVTSVIITRDGLYTMSAADDYTLRLWDLSTGSYVKDSHQDEITSLTISSDGRHAASTPNTRRQA